MIGYPRERARWSYLARSGLLALFRQKKTFPKAMTGHEDSNTVKPIYKYEKGTPENSVSKSNWQMCAICQEPTSETLQCHADTKRSDVGAGYKTLAGNNEKFAKLGCMPTDLCLSRLDESNGIEETFLATRH